MRKLSKEIDVTVGPAGQRKVCTVVFDLYRPSTATRPHRKPAILTTNGFGGSKDDQADLGRAFARRGYVVLSYSGLGFGGSDCKITLDDPDWDGHGRQAARQLPRRRQGGQRRDEDPVRPPRPGRPRRGEPSPRPAGRHGRRLLRRPGAVRGRRHRPPGRHDRADHHLERPVLLAGARTTRTSSEASPTGRLAPRRSAGPASSSGPASPTASSTPRPTRPATPAARTSPTRPAWPRRRWMRSATRRRTPWTSPGTPA